MEFKDHFSKSSEYYSKSRPQYPDKLFDNIVSFVIERNTAWDCGTGNGQTAVSLSKYFSKVIATDASSEQIKNAYANDKINYFTAKAEDSGINEHSIDLITSSTAVHWFDLEKFYKEVRRVSKPAAIIAVWSYGEFIPDDSISIIMNEFAFGDMLDYWPNEAKYNWQNKYRDIYFPFEEMAFPDTEMKVKWDIERTIGYLNSWSSVKNYIEKNGTDPVKIVYEKLKKVWETGAEKELKWKLFGKLGRVN